MEMIFQVLFAKVGRLCKYTLWYKIFAKFSKTLTIVKQVTLPIIKLICFICAFRKLSFVQSNE